MSLKTILIVDDTYENLYLLRVILEESGYVVIEANDGKDGLEKLKNNNVDLIISDILMPVMDGYMFCQECKKDKLFKEIPFIFFTSTYTEKLDEEFAKKLGAVEFLRKPNDQEKIVPIIQKCISGSASKAKSEKKVQFTEEEVLKLYSKRLISKLEQKNLELGNEIEERKKAEADLKSAKDFSESLISSMYEGLIVFSEDLKIISVNPAFCKMTGFNENELIDKKLPMPFNPPENIKTFKARYKKLLSGELKSPYESTYLHKKGHCFPVYVSISSIHDSKGNKIANFAIVKDITERRKAELDLKLAKEFSENLILNLNEGMLVANTEGVLIEANPAFCKMTGFNREELVGSKAPFPYWPPEGVLEIKNVLKSTMDGSSGKFTLTFMRKNEERFPVSVITSSVKDKDGNVTALYGTIEDITERVKSESLLKESVIKSNFRKNTILELTSWVGRDFNQSLNKITVLASKTLEVGRVSIWKLNKNQSEYHCEILYNQNSDSFSSGLILKREDHPKYFKQLIEKSIVSVNDAVENTLTKTMAKDYLIPNNITSKISIAVNGLDGLFGIICFEHVGSERTWEYDEEEFAISVANIVTLMIESTERKIAEDELALINEELSNSLNEINKLKNQLERENVYLRNELDLVFNYEEMIYGSVEFSNVLTEVEKVAPTDATVLLLGESGTGKELLARAVHNTSLRNNKPLIKVNCSAIPRELIESELFGHKKGSFTGAFGDKIGKFELADGGTLFLDEIGEMPMDMQPKILRFLQEGEIEVVGGTGLKKLDVRIIAATNKNLKKEIEKKQFREDLYFRLNVFPIEIPSLRNRKNDIPLLVDHFVDKFNKAYGKNIKFITDEAMNKLKEYDWPGNIRELENLIERASILSNSDTLLVPGFETSLQKAKQQINSKDLSLDSVQRIHILQVLEQCSWRISGPKGASVLLDLKPSTLRDKMAKLNIVKPK